MADILTKALSLVAVVAIGYGIKKLGWVKQEHFSVMAVIVLRITLPCALITSFNTFTITGALAWLIAFGLVVNLVQQGFTWLVTRHKPADERAFAILHSGSYNVGAFAMPYTAQFVGPQAMIYTALFDIGNSISAGGIGYGWGLATARGVRVTVRRFLAQMFKSPVFDTYLALLILRLAHISFPSPIIEFTSLVGAANPFAAMLMIGIGLEVILPKATWMKAATYLARRYIFVIIFCMVVWFVLPTSVFTHEVKVVLIMILWAPIAAMISGFVDEADGDVELATLMASISIIIAIIMMPTVYAILM